MQISFAVVTSISCAVTAQLIGAFVFTTQVVSSFFLNLNFQASNFILRCTDLFVSDLAEIRKTSFLTSRLIFTLCIIEKTHFEAESF